MTEKSFGEVAYDAYCKERDYKTFDGKKTPMWEELGEGIQKAWNVGVQAAIEERKRRWAEMD